MMGVPMTISFRFAAAAMLAAGLLLAAPARADIGAQIAYLEAHPDWLCGNQPEDYPGKDSNTELTVSVISLSAAVILEENVVYRHPREYRATVKYQANLEERDGALVLDTYAASLERADRLPAGGDWGDVSDVHMVLTLQPFYLQPGVYEFTGYSETGLGRILTSCNVVDVGRAPD